ncbi:MAG: hypothetical protein FWD84_05560 [Oscillospiraceae bacterium]|nr:hypothetical protein [Oscillospiraceae bacterium]
MSKNKKKKQQPAQMTRGQIIAFCVICALVLIGTMLLMWSSRSQPTPTPPVNPFDDLPEAQTPNRPPHEPDVVYDLEQLQLVGHDIPADSLLRNFTLTNMRMDEYPVPGISASIIGLGNFTLSLDSGAIEMAYTAFTDLDALTAVELAVGVDRAVTFEAEATLLYYPLRTNADYSIAATIIGVEGGDYGRRMGVYLAEVQEDGEVVRLVIRLQLEDFTERDHEAIAQLDELFGIDIAAHMARLLRN